MLYIPSSTYYNLQLLTKHKVDTYVDEFNSVLNDYPSFWGTYFLGFLFLGVSFFGDIGFGFLFFGSLIQLGLSIENWNLVLKILLGCPTKTLWYRNSYFKNIHIAQILFARLCDSQTFFQVNSNKLLDNWEISCC